jgi:hypothetical protein
MKAQGAFKLRRRGEAQMNELVEKSIFAGESISTFLSASREQELEALEKQAEWVAILDQLNAALNKISSIPILGPALPPLLIGQAHSAFLAAVRMSLAGQVHVAHTVVRSCIESALYALILQREPHTQKVWANRHNDRKACIKAFTPTAALTILHGIDSSLAQVFRETYEVTIDRGAHPNLLSLLQHLDFGRWEDEKRIDSALLLSECHQSVGQALNLCAIVGAAVASLCMYVMPTHDPAAKAHEQAMSVLRQLLDRVAG